jgi:hypothetical protein
MLDNLNETDYHAHPKLVRALEVLFIYMLNMNLIVQQLQLGFFN